MVVQRKWMYLEGIFVGGDIRSQLSEEAEMFDSVDSMFKKASNWIVLWFHNAIHVPEILLYVGAKSSMWLCLHGLWYRLLLHLLSQ